MTNTAHFASLGIGQVFTFHLFLIYILLRERLFDGHLWIFTFRNTWFLIIPRNSIPWRWTGLRQLLLANSNGSGPTDFLLRKYGDFECNGLWIQFYSKRSFNTTFYRAQRSGPSPVDCEILGHFVGHSNRQKQSPAHCSLVLCNFKQQVSLNFRFTIIWYNGFDQSGWSDY